MRLAIAFCLIAFPAAVYAKQARCLIEVDGKAFTFGQCNADREKDGSLSVGTGDASRSPIFAIVNATDGASAEGYWNEEPRASHAQSPLGTMRKSGGCWVNEWAKVCAWPSSR
ncbi:hypothetical protein MPPM_0780 [Methylorubrum populi]|uniref:Uncharacterized protein n=1 Tax=Methylorubrum populi TaxID=223967 RepID=A0A160PB60_9HYPH|nr:hypothetical protein MPPM_0780 [Methylorubrum populi]